MLRLCLNVLRNRLPATVSSVGGLQLPNATHNLQNVSRYSTLLRCTPLITSPCNTGNKILSNSVINNPKIYGITPKDIQSRSVTLYSLSKGKRKTVKAVLKRFYRLHWGIWIRTKAGRHRRMWSKSPSRKRRLRQHVFTNSTQSWMLDKMVAKFWRKPRYWVDNIYEPYNTREEFHATSKKPRDYWID